ncbi:hypothetical protein N0V93_003888 [Gnomoniopsis smithogilvyi]|uniref:Thaumatin-like protein n=1 Tax=Gnomoniopsis smithogilvyi TaxID=1191159 RepID=A0A9W8YXH8_9PEZI|nr:hypothetical protein N0V93_003888 [Gnomoniopsis smithogilvyi]
MVPNVLPLAALVVASFGGSALAIENRDGYESPGMTLVVQNRHNQPIIMSEDQYTLMPNDPTLAPGEHKIFKTGQWSGNFKVNEKKEGNTGQDTLVEFTVNNEGITLDVSYIAAFTLPVVCGCREDGAENVTLVTGCNIDLKKLNGGSCPPETHNGHGGCMNPMRSRPGDIGATSFFKPCEGAGYTHEGDHMVCLP